MYYQYIINKKYKYMTLPIKIEKVIVYDHFLIILHHSSNMQK